MNKDLYQIEVRLQTRELLRVMLKVPPVSEAESDHEFVKLILPTELFALNVTRPGGMGLPSKLDLVLDLQISERIIHEYLQKAVRVFLKRVHAHVKDFVT